MPRLFRGPNLKAWDAQRTGVPGIGGRFRWRLPLPPGRDRGRPPLKQLNMGGAPGVSREMALLWRMVVWLPHFGGAAPAWAVHQQPPIAGAAFLNGVIAAQKGVG
jgi:hypothetical protein